VLIFDDLHWADPALLDFVEQLPEWSRNHRILVVTLARPDLLERRVGWGQGKHGFISLHLGPLADIDMRSLVDGMAPGVGGDIREAIVDRAAGIPLYAVEMIRMMVAGGDLVEADGAYSFTGALSDLAVPESLQAVIGARIDRLEPADRSLLQDCAVVGHSFTIDTLAHVTGDSEDELTDRLRPLIRGGMLVVNEDPRSPERGQYQFVQSLIREVAHGRISRDVRRERHLEVARYLEQLGPELAVVVASHYLDAYRAASSDEADGLRSVARDALLRASDRAADLNSFEQARSLAERALEVTGADDERAPIWERIATAANVLADSEAAIAKAQQAIDYYRQIDDETGLNRAVRLLGDVYNGAGQSQRAIELLEAHVADKDLSTDPNLAVAASDLARAYLLTDAPRKTTAAAAEAALPALEQFALTDSIANAMITRGTALGALGRIRQGLALIKGALELADREGLAFTSIRGRINLSYVGSTEDPVMGFRATREAYDIARRTGQRAMVLALIWNLASWHAARGELDEAEALATDPILEGAPSDYRGQNLGIRAWIADLRGDRELGRELFEQARVLYEQSEDAQVLQDFERLQHHRASAEGRFEEAFEGSVRLATETTTPSIYLIGAARNAAILTGNVQWLRIVLDIYRDAGVLARYHTRQAETMLAFLENPSTDTLHRAGLLVEEADDLELALDSVILCASLALHAPPGPDQEHWEDELRARCDKHGLAGISDRYDTLRSVSVVRSP
jgi:tetratricopeptide (TPR) repeat protein